MSGLVETVGSKFSEQRYQTVKAYVEIMRELERAGYVKLAPLPRTGDGYKWRVILDLPGLRKLNHNKEAA